jgi:hypothetical protein
LCQVHPKHCRFSPISGTTLRIKTILKWSTKKM